MALAVVVLTLMRVAPASSQVLPDTGTTVQVGALRQQLEGLFAGGTSKNTPGWTITPSVGVEERWTDHLQELNSQGKSAFVTALTPSLQ